MVRALLAAAALCASTLLSGRTITVDDTDPTAEFSRIQLAIDAAVAGDVIRVGPGTYNENLRLKNGVQVIGSGHTVTTVNGGQLGAVATLFDCDSSTRLEGFTLTNGLAEFGGGVDVEGGAPIITLNRITGNTAVGNVDFLGSGGGAELADTDAVFSDNIVSGNSADYGGGIDILGGSPVVTRNQISTNSAVYGGGIEIFLSVVPIITNNLVTGNTASLSGPDTAFGGGIDIFYGYPKVIDNTLASNTGEAGGGISMIALSGSVPVVANNIIYNNRGTVESGGMFVLSDGGVVANNIFFLNAPDKCGGDPVCDGSLNLATDPLLVSPGTSDYRLRSNSPAIDSGRVADAPFDDLTGQRRPLDGNRNGTVGFDRGAYEFDRGDVRRLRFASASSMTWDAGIGAGSYHVYSADVATLPTSGIDTCRDPDDANRLDLTFLETRTPPPGAAFAYVVTAVVGGVEQSAGFSSAGLERPLPLPCPP